LDFCFGDVIEHPYLTHPEAELRLFQSTKALDAALAQLRSLVSEVPLDSVPKL